MTPQPFTPFGVTDLADISALLIADYGWALVERGSVTGGPGTGYLTYRQWGPDLECRVLWSALLGVRVGWPPVVQAVPA